MSTKPASTPSFEQVRQQRFAELETWPAAKTLYGKPIGAVMKPTPSPTVHSASTKGSYSGAELSASAVRPGADAALALPSRMGDRLHHRNRCVTDLTGQPVALFQGA